MRQATFVSSTACRYLIMELPRVCGVLLLAVLVAATPQAESRDNQSGGRPFLMEESNKKTDVEEVSGVKVSDVKVSYVKVSDVKVSDGEVSDMKGVSDVKEVSGASIPVGVKPKDSFAAEEFLTNADGFKIYCKYWSTDTTEPKALVFVAHGAAEHCQFYGELAKMLTNEGFFVFSHDHQGHGQSEGPKMQIPDFRHYSRDVLQHCEKVQAKFPNVPVYLLGHSMGGAVSVMSVLDRPEFFGLMVLIGPAVIRESGPIKTFFGKLIARMFPTFPVITIDIDDLSRDQAVVQMIKDDPLFYHGWMSAEWASRVVAAQEEMETRFPDIEIPFLALHGGDDKLVNCKGSTTLHTRASSQDKTLKIFPAGYHQLHRDIEPTKSQTFDEILKWLKDRTS